MKFNYLKYKDDIIPIYLQDNKKDTTFLFLHGLNSSSDFINLIKEMPHNFNVVALNFPGSIYWKELKPEEIKLEDWIEVAKIVLKNIKSKKIVIVAHSMAGGVAVELASDKRVKKIVMLSTINPSMQYTKGYKTLKSVIGDFETQKPSFLGQLIMFGAKFTKKGRRLLDSFSRKGRWYNLLANYVLNPEFMKNLDKKYHEAAEKLVFVIGDKDGVIGTEAFLKYAEELNRPAMKIGTTHSPLYTVPSAMNNFLNHLIPTKKRFWFTRFVTFSKKTIDIKPSDNSEDIKEAKELKELINDTTQQGE
ncbi:alpha/beta fold hydrolase [Mycoplasmopsis adleri]|uniref:alpha/beta fold hydrolase n=1 Tax=Mycoplasmopsis adleri TaxID=51362 RepID=UPI0038730485